MNSQSIPWTRPVFPKRAVITAGMPYGNKDLHFGHIGGVFVHADAFTRFLRDRIGRENVIFVSGTDCYGSPIVEDHRQAVENGQFEGDLDAFVKMNHERQLEVLRYYNIDINLFGASGFGRSAEIHREMCGDFLRSLYANGHLTKMTTPQFFDIEAGIFLTGRQVVGRCPIQGCSSEKGYADECSLGHQYEPKELIDPKSTLSGKAPEMRDVTNWYLDLEKFRSELEKWLEDASQIPGSRKFAVESIREFFERPTIHVTRDQLESLAAIADRLPPNTREEGKSKSVRLVFESLTDREKACALLTEHSIRYRSGKTLVPFRLTGDMDWGLPAPAIEDLKDVTFWVWPESLWAPISFTAAYLESEGEDRGNWKQWWSSKDSRVYQVIGEDNVYFYSLAEMSMFMGDQGNEFTSDPEEGQLQLPELIANCHILFFDKKASSSGKIKPPMARDLLDYYTADQLRAHFMGLGLGKRSVGFQPKPLNPNAGERDGDPVLKEGNLLSNVFNRAVRSCFYTTQEHFDGKIPVGEVSEEILEESNAGILKFEEAMYRHEFHQAMSTVDNYIRGMNKIWDKNMRSVRDNGDENLRRQTVIDVFHMVRVAAVLMHPVAPEGTEMIREFLNLGEEFWSWDRIFDPIYAFMEDPEVHRPKFLEPRVDFFGKHPSQVRS